MCWFHVTHGLLYGYFLFGKKRLTLTVFPTILQIISNYHIFDYVTIPAHLPVIVNSIHNTIMGCYHAFEALIGMHLIHKHFQ